MKFYDREIETETLRRIESTFKSLAFTTCFIRFYVITLHLKESDMANPTNANAIPILYIRILLTFKQLI